MGLLDTHFCVLQIVITGILFDFETGETLCTTGVYHFILFLCAQHSCTVTACNTRSFDHEHKNVKVFEQGGECWCEIDAVFFLFLASWPLQSL